MTDTPRDVSNFAWSSDSRRLILIRKDPALEELQAAKDKSKDQTRDLDNSAKDKKSKTQKHWVIDRLQFKEDTIGYLDRRCTHLYVFDLASKSLTQITSGDFDDSQPAWSPDGKLLAFVSNRSLPDPDCTYDRNVWIVSAVNTDKGAPITQVTTNPGEDHSPAWSPDGKSIAYSSQLDPKLFQYATHYVAVVPVPALAGQLGKARVLTLAFDRNSSDPRFAPPCRRTHPNLK